jgi:Tfp pilus tip-associated adhesin PilY1
MNIIREATYSFSQASIQSSRTADENFVYEGSFQPVNDPFWFGHLRKYQILAADVVDGSGNVTATAGSVGAMLLDAGEVLKATAYTDRVGKIKTYVGGSLVDFSTSISKTYFDVLTDAERDAIVGYLYGDPIYNLDNWKLGDVFRSTPITIGTPSAFFEDKRDANNAFATHRTNHERSSANGYRLIVSGANGGMFHAFKTGNMTEAWSFVPPNLLSKLKNIVHSAHPTALIHQYFVDGPVSGADVWWLTSGSDASGKTKVASDWRTIIVFGEGRGSTDRLWSSSVSCDSGLSATYSATYSNYCGYYALNLTSSLSPAYLWRLNTFDATTQAPYMGESWSKMMIGRVLTKTGSTETEKWVGFVGGGYNANACANNSCADTRGKGFFVVDLSDGHILWSMTHTTGTASNTRHPSMRYSLPAPPSIVDYDNDGFIDTAYIGDLGGNMWRFKFCTKALLDAGNCTTANWTGGIFVDSSSGSIRPIHTGAAVAKDASGNTWVFYGTGDKVDPTAPNAQEYFFAVKDLDRTSVINGFSDIDLINSTGDTYDAGSKPLGYRIALPGGGQKILAEPTIFGGVAYFTSFTPGNSNDPCVQSGEATLNAVNMTTAAGIFTGETNPRQMVIGSGMASSPIISLAPGGTGSAAAQLYITVSGGGLSSASTQKLEFNVPGVTNRTGLLYWRDRRVR